MYRLPRRRPTVRHPIAQVERFTSRDEAVLDRIVEIADRDVDMWLHVEGACHGLKAFDGLHDLQVPVLIGCAKDIRDAVALQDHIVDAVKGCLEYIVGLAYKGLE